MEAVLVSPKFQAVIPRARCVRRCGFILAKRCRSSNKFPENGN